MATNRFLFSIFIALFVAGCAVDEAHRHYTKERYTAKAPAEVQILFEPPTRPHKILADFQSRYESPLDMQKKAAEIGADAVVVSAMGGLVSTSETKATQTKVSQETLKSTYSRITGTAVKFE